MHERPQAGASLQHCPLESPSNCAGAGVKRSMHAGQTSSSASEWSLCYSGVLGDTLTVVRLYICMLHMILRRGARWPTALRA